MLFSSEKDQELNNSNGLNAETGFAEGHDRDEKSQQDLTSSLLL